MENLPQERLSIAVAAVASCEAMVDLTLTYVRERTAFGQPVGFSREGGSGPEADLAEVLGAPVVFLGVGLPDDAIHSPNERVVLPMLERGAEAAAYLWSELASPGSHRPGS